ncbi:MAG TPA: class I SAM-dependent methyltransferase [Pyrinomonadaceae bacterium]|nr:class I SAM-dependent methyltransferase [Pyrinomonadaceae bacterium]
MSNRGALSWEEAVRWYREQPNNEAEVRNNYFDLPVLGAAERYARSEEFAEVLHLLGPGNGKEILDLGAGNGIASYALAAHGWNVTALEPDESSEVGAGAIDLLVKDTGLPIKVVREFGERLPFADESFSAIHARQVLHHAHDLENMVKELARVLRPGGLLLSTREHVIDGQEHLELFRDAHPLHFLYGGENAYTIERYVEAFERAGLRLLKMWGPVESILNLFTGTEEERQTTIRQIANHSCLRFGRLLGWSERFRAAQLRRHTQNDRTPGRIYSFLLQRP